MTHHGSAARSQPPVSTSKSASASASASASTSAPGDKQGKKNEVGHVKPLPPVTVTFLGTSSGGGPILSRNCSSLAADFGSEIWIVDAADGTLMRLHQSSLRIANISRLFITHMHADHVLGIVAILMTVMSGVGNKPGDVEATAALGVKKKATFNIYGPVGLRKFIRTILEITTINLSGVFAVHELLPPGEKASVTCHVSDLHPNEAVGRDIEADQEGVWRDVLQEGNGRSGKGWGVSAGPIHHRVPAIGYVLQEPTPRLPLDTTTLIPLLQSNAAALASLDPPVKHPLSLLSHLTSLPPPAPYTLPSGEVLHPPAPSGVHARKLVIFGDCSGGTENPVFETMCRGASLLVHECTNAAIPEAIQRGQKGMKVRTKELEPSLEKKREKQFAQNWKAEKAKAEHQEGDHNHKHGDESLEEEHLTADQLNRRQVQKKALGRGHSTPEEVGKFARSIQAKRVVVNHFSAMFPSPRYLSTDPFPSILSPISPYPYPTPHSLVNPHSTDRPLEQNGLTTSELHTRLIMQSLADQITDLWTKGSASKRNVNPVTEAEEAEEVSVERMAVPARDFMVVHVPSHELSGREQDDIRKYREEADRVREEWSSCGGVEIVQDGKKVWLGA